MSFKRAIREEIKDVSRERDYVLRCKLSDYQYQLLECVRRRNVDSFKQLLSMGVDPGFVTDKGETCLHIVCGLSPDEASLEILRMLVYFGTSLNTMDRFGQMPLHHAARTSAQIVKILLEGGANTDLKDNSGRTPLMEACNSSVADGLTVVQYLMDRGCNIYASDEVGCTALHYICMNKSQLSSIKSEIVYKLLYAGLSATAADKTGKMAICYEIEQFLGSNNSSTTVKDDKLSVIKVLIQGGSTYNRKNQRHVKMIWDFVMRYKSPFYLLLQEFEPTLTIPAISSIRSCVVHSDKSEDALIRELTSMSHRVQSLKFISRLNVRETLKGKCFAKVELLPLPKSLKQYLLLID